MITLPPSLFSFVAKMRKALTKKHNIWWRSNNWEQLHPVALLAGCKGSFNKPLKHVDYCKNWTYHNVDIWTLKETLDFIACLANIKRNFRLYCVCGQHWKVSKVSSFKVAAQALKCYCGHPTQSTATLWMQNQFLETMEKMKKRLPGPALWIKCLRLD